MMTCYDTVISNIISHVIELTYFDALIRSIFQTLAHEIGHNLGMSHDFFSFNSGCKDADDGSYKLCTKCANWNGRTLTTELGKSGECCTGFMDYGNHPEYWSKCSVRNFEQHYVSQNWAKCMPLGNVLKTL